MDREKHIAAQTVVKALIGSPSFPSNLEGPEAQKKWIDEMFLFCLKKIEDYARLAEAPSNAPVGYPEAPQRPEYPQRAPSLPPQLPMPGNPPNRQFAFASEKQSKRAYALQMANGWQPYQVKILAQKYGFQNTRKIPVGVYEQFCSDLQAGPDNLSASSAHLEQQPF